MISLTSFATDKGCGIPKLGFCKQSTGAEKDPSALLKPKTVFPVQAGTKDLAKWNMDAASLWDLIPRPKKERHSGLAIHDR